MKFFFHCLLVICCLGIFSPGFAADNLLDELDALMETLPEAKARDTAVDNAPLFKQLSDHLDLNLNISYFHYLTSLDNHDSNEGEVQLKFKTWGGVEKHSFHLEGWVEYGTQDNTYAGVTPLWKDEDRERAILEISQVYGLFDLNGIGVTLGKKIIPNNTNSIYPLSQVYHPLDLNEPIDPRAYGLWQLRVDKLFGDDTLVRASVYPVFQDPKVPSATSRWMTVQADSDYWYSDEFDLSNLDAMTSFILYYFGGFLQDNDFLKFFLDTKTVVIENDGPGAGLEDMGYSGLIKTMVGDVDLFGSVFHGPNPFPVVYFEDRGSEVALIKRNPSVLRLATGGTFTWQNFEFHTELLYNHAKDNTDDSYISYTGGATITDALTATLLNIDQVHWRIDYAGESVVHRQDAQGYYLSSEYIRPFTKDILLQLLLQVNSDTNLYYHMDLDIGRDAQYHRIGGTYRFYPGMVLEVYTELFDGDDTSFIGLWRDNDRLGCQIKWSF